MAFEFFFGVFGLISNDSKSRHKSRLEGDWRLFTPLGASLFREAGGGVQKSAPHSPASFSTGSAGSDGKQRPIFSTTGTLANNNNNSSVSEGMFSSTSSSSSASSIASSGISSSTSGSTATLIKQDSPSSSPAPLDGKLKYEFLDHRLFHLGLQSGGKDMKMGGSTAGSEGAGDGMTAAGSDGVPQAGASADEGGAQAGSGRGFRAIYCRIVCIFLWIHVLRLLAGLIVEKSLFTMDFYHLGAFKVHFLIPALCLAIQVAAVSLIFIRNNQETNWLVPFYSSKDYLIRSRSNFRPKMEDYGRRVRFSVFCALLCGLTSSVSLSAYLIHCVMEPSQSVVSQTAAAAAAATGSGQASAGQSQLERTVLMILLGYDIVWAIYSTYICFLVAFYFNLICSIMKSRFYSISKIIEDLAESNTSKTTNQARKITTLYLEHNEACELLDESNDFWQYLIFFTYFTYIPAYCYCLYNLFFVEFDSWPSFITWVIHTHTGFIIMLISFSAAGVSTEAHAPYTSLHTLSLIQLPLDVEVNIATFLHRVRGLTIGYSCYDLFAITNASMSNTAAACASYFLIVADFSRSSVFTLAQMNGSSTVATTGSAAASALSTTQAPVIG